MAVVIWFYLILGFVFFGIGRSTDNAGGYLMALICFGCSLLLQIIY